MGSTRAGRAVLGAGGLLAAFVAALSCAQPSAITGPSCDTTQTQCGDVCSDTQTDSENCGGCGKLCPSAEVCVKGACVTECPSGDTLCTAGDSGAGTCVNTRSDNHNCGSCHHSCPTGQVCSSGVCNSTCGSMAEGQTLCGGDGGSPVCANLQTDDANCGKCGTVCNKSQVCTAGQCTSVCTPDQTVCGGDGGASYCANTQTDNANCGTCGQSCGTLEVCSGGACGSECSFQQILCTTDGGTPYCADNQTDNKNCGTCGNICPSATPVCSGGKCSTGALPPSCVTANGLKWCYDPNTCGKACNFVCASVGLTPANTVTTFNAQNSNALCQNIATAFGVGSISVSAYSNACLEDSWFGIHTVGGGLTAPLLCSTTASCPSAHLTNMDQLGVACGANSRRSACACQ